MTPFNSSSRQNRLLNPDGSWNVHCYSCNEFISTSFQRIQRAQCELCRRVEAGEILTPEAIKAYRLSKGQRSDISMLLIPEQPKAQGKFSLRSLGNGIVSALGLFGKDKEAEKAAQPSVQISKQKRRPRLFSNIDIGTELGSMEDVDKITKDKKS